MKNIEAFIKAVRETLQPEPRGNATANTLEQITKLLPARITLADLAIGWETIAASASEGDVPPVAARNATCRELAAVAEQYYVQGEQSLDHAIEAWETWQAAFAASEDPRQAAMATTFKRELAVLQAAK
jgi:hypothetical protein